MSNTGLHIKAGFAVPHSALEVVVEALNDKDDLLWNSICPEYAQQTFSMDPVESLLKVHVVMYNCLCHSVHSSMMLCRVNIWSVHPRPFRKPACSCRSHFRDPSDDELDVAGDRQKGDSSPVVTVAQGS